MFLGAALIIPLLLFLMSRSPNAEEKNTSLSPTPTSSTPTIGVDPSSFSVVSVQPNENPTEPYLPIQQVTFTFTKGVLPTNVFYEIDPPTEAVVRQGAEKNQIIISSKTAWKEGSTIITLLQKTTSIEGLSLSKPSTYMLKTGYPRTAPPDAIME